MIYLHTMLWVFVVLFAIIGAFRGSSRELLVTIALLITLFTLDLLGMTRFFRETLTTMEGGLPLFWVRTILMTILTMAGYQIPRENAIMKDRMVGSIKLDKITGFIVGGINGYMIFGSIWYFLHAANYPGLALLNPAEGPIAELNTRAINFIQFLPPAWLQGTVLYIGVGLLVIFILVMVV
ncbi:MAG TPA: hypothetical protein ENN32_05630 [Chloroflexi bacterium]|nr:hypothetical protein [Chloroflexota bacterium]